MKKIKFGIVEILGYSGMLIWIGIIFLRGNLLSNNEMYLFFLGVLPNLGAAWAATMFAKWLIIFIFKKDITVKIHFFICLCVFALAVLSEFIHDIFLQSPLDIYDIILTFIAQTAIFTAPILMKDKYFRNY